MEDGRTGNGAGQRGTAGDGGLRRGPSYVLTMVSMRLFLIQCAEKAGEHLAHEHALVLAAPVLRLGNGTGVARDAQMHAHLVGRTARNTQVIGELGASATRPFGDVGRHRVDGTKQLRPEARRPREVVTVDALVYGVGKVQRRFQHPEVSWIAHAPR